MYFPYGWPRKLFDPNKNLLKVGFDRVKLLFATLSIDSLTIWYLNKPCVPVTSHKRDIQCLSINGDNVNFEWRPDSTRIAVTTKKKAIIIYQLVYGNKLNGVYEQTDPPQYNLRRESAELYIEEKVPDLNLIPLQKIELSFESLDIKSISMKSFAVASNLGKIVKFSWDGIEEKEHEIDLRNISYFTNQQHVTLLSTFETELYITSMEYSPLLNGFAVVFNDGR